MASPKNSNRSKRKYGDGQKTRTARNKAARAARHELRMERFNERAQALVGKDVKFAGKQVGKVVDVIFNVPRVLVIEDRESGRRYERFRRQVKPV